MPRSPLISEARELSALQRALGLRHAADALFPTGRVRFRVLDGLHVLRGVHWSRVDHLALAQARDGWRGRTDAEAATVDLLFTHYASILDSHPLALRRVVLYELLQLLRTGSHAPTADEVTSLGVDTWEAEALAHAAAHEPHPTVDRREAAEEIVDAWRAGRIHRAFDCAVRLGEPGRDAGLSRLVLDIADQDRRLDELLARAAELEDAGDPDGAAALYLEAARAAVDDATAVEGLLRTAADPDPARRPTAVPVGGGVRVQWLGDGPHRVLRRRGAGGPWMLLAARAPGPAFTDADVTPGETVQYVVLPVQGHELDGPALLGAPVRYAPEVENVRVQEARDRVSVMWRTPPAALAVQVERLEAHGGSFRVAVDGNGFDDRPVPPGEHRYLIRCRYSLPDGGETLSDGVVARAAVPRWPAPVTRLFVTTGPRPGRIAVGWDGAEGSQVRLYDKPLPAAGLDLPVRELPDPMEWETTALPHGVELLPPRRGMRFRLTAVSVIEERATTGASVVVELTAPVRNFRVRRVAAELVRVTFEWPERADRVDLSWTQSGAQARRIITRAAYRRGALEFAVATAPADFHIEPVPPDADVVIAAAPAGFRLPADLAVSYDVRKPSWWSGAKRRITVRADCAPADVRDVVLPDVVLVARPGVGPLGSDPPRPQSLRDGVTLLHLSGSELGIGRLVSRDVEVTLGGAGPPYALRVFLLGPGAESVRLIEPPWERLVVR
ncbi:hypothetical protein ACFY1U_14525 [Streptomyces sp. NPDC001351]|uniref:hypothetical protein n=1 Tax=Streptomyces sp. NPDC001351 TaxID=3364564 RepID=UPI0036C12165